MVYRESYINKLQQQCFLFKFKEGFIFYSLRSRPPSQKEGWVAEKGIKNIPFGEPSFK